MFWYVRVNYIEGIFSIEDGLVTIIDHSIVNVIDSNHCIRNIRRKALEMKAVFDPYFHA